MEKNTQVFHNALPNAISLYPSKNQKTLNVLFNPLAVVCKWKKKLKGYNW